MLGETSVVCLVVADDDPVAAGVSFECLLHFDRLLGVRQRLWVHGGGVAPLVNKDGGCMVSSVVGVPLSWVMSPAVSDSSWSTETHCPGDVIVGVECSFLRLGLLLHGLSRTGSSCRLAAHSACRESLRQYSEACQLFDAVRWEVIQAVVPLEELCHWVLELVLFFLRVDGLGLPGCIH